MAERRLDVYLDGTPVGVLTQNRAGRVDFAYHESYGHSSAIPLSLSLPIGRSHHPPKAVNAFLAGLLPDSGATLERWGREFGVSPRNPFALLAHVGRDAAGAVQILPEGAASDDAATRQGHIDWLSDDDLFGIVHEIAKHPMDWSSGQSTGRWSLAGAQSKVALFRGDGGSWGVPQDSTPTTHILKPSIPGFEHHHVNEHLCLRAAQLAGLPAAKTEVLSIDGVEVLISERFDRRHVNERWIRIHQEDLCQALSVHPSMKYQSDGGPGLSEIGGLIRTFPAPDRLVSARRCFDAVAYNVLIGATDAHAKNYSILLAAGSRAQFGPLYDVATALPYDNSMDARSAMKVGNTWVLRKVSSADWAAVAARLGIPRSEALDRVAELRAVVPDAFRNAAEAASVPDVLRDHARLIAGRVADHVNRPHFATR